MAKQTPSEPAMPRDGAAFVAVPDGGIMAERIVRCAQLSALAKSLKQAVADRPEHQRKYK